MKPPRTWQVFVCVDGCMDCDGPWAEQEIPDLATAIKAADWTWEWCWNTDQKPNQYLDMAVAAGCPPPTHTFYPCSPDVSNERPLSFENNDVVVFVAASGYDTDVFVLNQIEYIRGNLSNLG